jgi:hypothetical protein
MNRRSTSGAGLVGLALLMSGCVAFSGSGEGESGALVPTRSGTAYVLSGEQLSQRGTDVLSTLGRLSAVQVRRGGTCPSVQMRGQKTYMAETSPYVYVNGAHAGNTCLLEMMRSEDVGLIEVYPNGVTLRPGYEPNPNGLILIFLRGAEPGGE